MTAHSRPFTGQPFIPAGQRESWTNPYRPGQPADGSGFYDRAPARQWVHQQLAAYRPDRPPLIRGRAGSGKTSFLHHLERSPFTGVRFAAIPAANLATDQVDALLWTMAVEGTKRLQGQGIQVPAIPRRLFMTDPTDAFPRYFLRPVLDALRQQKFVLAIDDAHLLGHLLNDRPEEAVDLFNRWQALGGEFQQFNLLLAATPGEPGRVPAFFAQLPAYELPPLPREDAYALLQEPVPYPIYDDVAAYIYDLAGGHPAALQAVGRALFSRWQQGALSHITTADALAVARGETTLPPRTGKTTSATPAAQWDPLPAAGRNPRPWILGAGLLLVLILLLLFFLRREQTTPLAAPPIATTTPEMTTSAAVAFSSPAAPTRITMTARPPSPAAAGASGETDTPAASRPTTATLRPTRPAAGVVLSPTTLPSPTAPASATVSATPLPEQIVRPADGMPMQLVPAGTFVMGELGDRPEVSDDETPEHPVTLDAFYIDRYEVSVEQFATYLNELAPADYRESCPGLGCFLSRRLIGSTSYLEETEPEDDRVVYAPLAGYAYYPVNHVSWNGARDYCTAVGARLPTEAEWEYAARGTDRRIYPWGNEPPDETRAVFASSSFTNLKPVDALPAGASPFGVFGLAGSVWEWVADYYAADYYADSPAENPTGPAEGPGRVTRGGGWPNNNQADRIRVTNRNWLDPTFLSSDLGFRCAWDGD